MAGKVRPNQKPQPGDLSSGNLSKTISSGRRAAFSMGDLINLQKAGYSLVLGGARSGKSTYAESVIENVGGGFYIATSEALDEEMTARIAAHRERRGDDWQTLEEPVLLQHALLSIKGRGKPALVDCLTLWLSNLMELEKNIEAEIDGLCDDGELLKKGAIHDREKEKWNKKQKDLEKQFLNHLIQEK